MSARTRRMGALALCLLLCGGPAALAAPGPQAETLPFMLLTDDGAGGGAPEQVAATAADAAACLRGEAGALDATGNGVIDAHDAEAILLHAAGALPDLTGLPGVLAHSLLGEEHMTDFCYTGVRRGEGYYRSKTVSYTLTVVEEEDLTYYVADIVLRDLRHFRTAFGEDTYKRSEFVVDMARRNDAIVAINGDYFTGRENDGPVIRNGELYRNSVDKARDACVLYRDGTVKTYAPDEIDAAAFLADGAYQCWTFGPSLLDENGQPKTERSQFRSTVQGANPRSALGYIEPGHYLFITVDGRGRGGSDGMTMKELSQLMYELGCTVAYNLDGGGTAIMADASGAISRQSNSERRCSDILFIVEDYTAFWTRAGEEDGA